MADRKSILRLRKKHTGSRAVTERRPDPQKLIRAQSLSGAVIAGVAVILLASATWTLVAVTFDRVFPWFSIVQGALAGLAVRRYGRGFDWRFPLVAGLLAWAGAFFGNLMVALPTTGSELGASVFEVLRGLTWWSFETFFSEVITIVDHIYALFAAAVSAFYARRRLNRHEVYALRTMKGDGGGR